VNIGDVGHTPGVLRLLERNLPNVDVRLWPSDVGNGVEEMLRRRFPRLTIVRGPGADAAALAECDLFLHGSGPSLVGRKEIDRWTATRKPYGIYGITFPGSYAPPAEAAKVAPASIEMVSRAAFAFFRDSPSLAFARERGATCPIMQFAPDGAFAVDLRDDARAAAFLREHRLADNRFLCVIPRQRYTPYWEIPGRAPTSARSPATSSVGSPTTRPCAPP
jgi:hypothetical protein